MDRLRDQRMPNIADETEKMVNLSFRLAWILLAAARLAQGNETCGLQNVTYAAPTDVIFSGNFDTQIAAGLGPTLATVAVPSFGVAPTVTITAPATGSALVSGTVQVAGTVTGPPGTGVTVNGISAYVTAGKFVTPPFKVEPTTTSLSAQAMTLDNLSASNTINITSGAADAGARLATDSPIGFAALPVQFNLTTSSTQPVLGVVVDFGDGSPNYTDNRTGYVSKHTYSNPGLYVASATITFADSSQQYANTMVMALSMPEQRADICSTFAYVRAQMIAAQPSAALQGFTVDFSTKLSPLFQALSTRGLLANVGAQLGTLAAGTIGLDTADLMAVRDTNGRLLGFPIHFIRDTNGVWRINAM